MTNPATPAAAPQSITYKTDAGLNLVADAWGTPDAPPVLLLHGGGQTRHAWGGTAQMLAAQGRYAVALDMRGHGHSDWAADGDYYIDGFVADLHSVLRHFTQRPVLVGASLGGITSLLTEGEAPESVCTGLVLVDITPRAEPEGVKRIRDFMTSRPGGFASLDEAADAVAAYIPHRPRPKNLNGLAKNLRLRDNGRYYWHWDPQLMANNNRRRDADRLLDAARALTVPTLLVRGQLSDIVSDATQAEFLEAVPHAKHVDVSGAGHMVAGDQNDAFSKGILEFLTGL